MATTTRMRWLPGKTATKILPQIMFLKQQDRDEKNLYNLVARNHVTVIFNEGKHYISVSAVKMGTLCYKK